MTTQAKASSYQQASLPKIQIPKQIILLTRRNLVTIFRTPEALIPPIAISVFFLLIYESTLGQAAGFVPGRRQQPRPAPRAQPRCRAGEQSILWSGGSVGRGSQNARG